jgi:hypothetical protein
MRMDSLYGLRRLLPLTFFLVLALASTADAAVNVSETSHDFGSQDVTTLSGTHTFTLTNEDTTPLNSVTIKGETFVPTQTTLGTDDPGADDFLISSTTCGGALGPNDQCEIRVRFVPSGEGARSSIMRVLTDGPTVDDVTLSGTGTTLLQGPPGEKGDKGDKGDTGEQGLKGDQGIQGVKGDQGLQGVKGDLGPQGVKGDQGIQGVKGDQGIQGVKGDQGIQGVKGDIGPQGVKGDACASSEPACRGPKGDKGDTGIQGIQGIQGPTGTRGPQGLPGAKGDQGPAGRDAVIACKVARTKRTKKLKVICTVNFANAR